MQNATRAVLIIAGDACNLNQAWPEMVEIAKSYGLAVDLIKEEPEVRY